MGAPPGDRLGSPAQFGGTPSPGSAVPAAGGPGGLAARGLAAPGGGLGCLELAWPSELAARGLAAWVSPGAGWSRWGGCRGWWCGCGRWGGPLEGAGADLGDLPVGVVFEDVVVAAEARLQVITTHLAILVAR